MQNKFFLICLFSSLILSVPVFVFAEDREAGGTSTQRSASTERSSVTSTAQTPATSTSKTPAASSTPSTDVPRDGEQDVSRDDEKSQQVSLPSAVGIIIKKVIQSVDLMFTFDPLEDAKKRVNYAQTYLETANKMLKQSNDPTVEERALKLIDRAQDLISDVARDKPSWSEKDPNREMESLLEDYSNRMNLLLDEAVTVAADEVKAGKVTASKTKASSTLQGLKGLSDGKSEMPVPENLTDAEDIKPLPYLSLEEFLKKVSADSDRDGISDEEEKKLGISIKDFDTDGDALSDKSEITTYGTDPKNPDTDGDGYRDGLEVLKGFNPKGPGKLNY